MSASHPEHLIFLVNGLWGSSRNWYGFVYGRRSLTRCQLPFLTNTCYPVSRKFFKQALRKRMAPERILAIASRSNGFLKVGDHAWQAVNVHVLAPFLLLAGSSCSQQCLCFCMRGML